MIVDNMIVGNKYWVLVGSNGTNRLQLGVLKTLKYDNRENVTEFSMTSVGFENKYFNDSMLWYYEGESKCTHDHNDIFEYDDLDKAYLAFLKSYGLNLNIIGEFVDTQIEEYPERFL